MHQHRQCSIDYKALQAEMQSMLIFASPTLIDEFEKCVVCVPEVVLLLMCNTRIMIAPLAGKHVFYRYGSRRLICCHQ